jgi:hypothetical protein
MKKTIYILIISICIGLDNPAIASEDSNYQKGFSATVSMKMWVNEWESPTLLTFNNSNLVRSQHSDTVEFAFIPSLNFTYNRFFVSGSYLPETDYSFEIQDVSSFETKFHATRSEWDINFGYYILPSLIISAGYKDINRDFNIHVNTNNIPNLGKADTNGFTIGIASFAPLNDLFAMYGSFTFGWLDTDKQLNELEGIIGNSGKFDVEYYLGELGLTYSSQLNSIPQLNTVSIYMGYRYQALNEERGNLYTSRPLEVTDTTSGFVFGVNLTF